MYFGKALCVSVFGLVLSAYSPHPAKALTTVSPFASDDMDFAAAILVEAETGTVLFQHNPHARRSPASTQKLLLLLVVMEAVADGKYSLEDSVTTSAWASRMGGSQVFLKQGEVFTLGQLLETITIASANDACVAVAEHIGGTVDGFVSLMNSRARELGLETTHCVNVHGLDDTPSDRQVVRVRHVEPAQEPRRRYLSGQPGVEKHAPDRVQGLRKTDNDGRCHGTLSPRDWRPGR